MKRSALLVGAAVAGTLLSLAVAAPANATCLREKNRLITLKPGLNAGPIDTLYIYLNAPNDPNGAACPRDIRRTGIGVEDAENIVRATVASINEAGTTTPRLVYGGRVCFDTEIDCSDLAGYVNNWDSMTNGLPPGVVIQTSACVADDPSDDPGGVAAAKGCDRTAEPRVGSTKWQFENRARRSLDARSGVG